MPRGKKSSGEESAPTEQTGGGGSRRELIRPSLATHGRWVGAKPERRRREAGAADETGSEAKFFQKQVNLGTHVVITLEDGEVLTGVLEWYDRDSVKLRQDEGPSLLILKHAILHAAREGKTPSGGRRKSAKARAGRRG